MPSCIQWPRTSTSPPLFIAVPVFGDAAEPVGVFAVRLSSAPVNDLMTREWRAGLIGDTGETYLVGADRLMRSDARHQGRPGYLERTEITSQWINVK